MIYFLRTLVSNGYRVAAICPGDLTDPVDSSIIVHYRLPTPKVSFWYNAGFVNTLLAIEQRLWNAFRLARKLNEIRPDILICYEPDSWLVSVLAKWWFGCKVVVDLREVYDDRAFAFPKFTQGIVRRLLKALMRWLSLYTDEVVHVSAERQQVYSYLHKSGAVISSYPELHLFPPRDVLRSDDSANIEPGLVTAIHAGALRFTYASEQLLDAMVLATERIPRIRFVVLGGIDGALRNATLVESLMNKGVLEFLGQVPFSEVVRKLLVSDIGINLVLPVDTAHLLAAPQKLFEYFAASLPVVAADVPTIRRVVTKYECGLLVDPSSPDEIASALVRLAQDVDLRRRMGQNARRAAETEFNWEREVPKLCLLMRSLQD